MKVLLLALTFVSTAALAHSWYPWECCGGSDCEPIDDKRVQVVPGGYRVDGRFFIAEPDARQSQDGNYHICFYPNPDTVRCFFKPLSSS